MAVERAREFLEAAAADPGLWARVDSAGSREARWEAIRAAGYGDVTAEDLNAAVEDVKSAAGVGPEGELTDAQLEGAAGGGFGAKVVGFIGEHAWKLNPYNW
jgi:predicted ribosomally synthesized peptide with nif11-like leader